MAFLSPESDKIRDCWISNRINEECTLEFYMPMDSQKWQYLTPECKIIADDREFVILKPDSVDVERDAQGKRWGKVMALESWRLLDKEYVTVSNDPQNPNPADLQVSIVSGGPSAGGYSPGSAGSALTYILQGSDWTIGTVDVEGTYDLETEKESRLSNVKEVQRIWGGYLIWDSSAKTVSLRDEEKWQDYNGFQVRYRKNMQNVTRTANYDIVTRLYAFGENDLDIASVNNGVKYLENFNYTDNVYVGVYQDQDMHTPQMLKSKTEKALEKLSRPRYTYRTKITDLRTLPEYQHEKFQLGDIVDVIDEDLGFNVQARLVKHKYNVFMPWKCELDIGEPEERLAARLADTFNVSRFIKEALKPNPATSNLLKGFINTFATTINSANGKLVWDDATLQAIEVDGQGDETGRRVRITPGGIGVSVDGGQTYATAMTGEGILANTIIVSELYALSTDDGYTALRHDGLHIFDENETLRVLVGWWLEGAVKHFGIKIHAIDGTVLLDDRGLLQTWQEGNADNVDSTSPLVMNIYLPPETRSIRRALLRFRRQNFRAYSTGAASGGGVSSTTVSGGSVSTSTASGGSSLVSSGAHIWYTDSGFTSAMNVTTWDGLHNHGIPQGTGLVTQDESVVWFSESGTHGHALQGVNHLHNVLIPNHTHNVTMPNHAHDFSVPNHIHQINYGIYTSTLPLNTTIIINGINRTTLLGGPFNNDQSNLDIAPYLNIGQWNTIEIGSSRLGRIDATVFLQALMGV